MKDFLIVCLQIALLGLILTIFGIYIYALIHCWNIPIAVRSGICAMLH